ncbi:MAG: Crp/Fnr family transcriptional regulator [Burkholderiales bacterium]|mgnify:CR=1 FL=1|jgi:CRP-like cAMP-binding protein|nr:Crp/Fnr family transcriptional regulator [Burkholderiales bacterium]MBP7521484.1 Crp/Fnr family transcriptional regulator [Leptothrix sp. (in: b-proteobacteria)]
MEARSFDVPRYLAVLPLFQEMTPPELQRLAQGSRVRRMARSDTVFRVGEVCDEFHVTVMGQVKLYALSPAGQEKVIELIGPGQTFAEALMFSDKPYIINAQTLTDTLLLSVSKEVVVGEIHREPRFALRMLAGMSKRLHGLVHDVQAYSLHSGVQRVIGYLLRDLPGELDFVAADASEGPEGCYAGCQKQCNGCSVNPAGGSAAGAGSVVPARELRVSLPVSKATIASRLSLTPEYFSRVLHELEGVGLIQIDKRDIRIPDPGRLARYQLQ